ncbi:hypothetical protein M5689_001072 [Euphorbia peplus]|nr:hypothetical protein M5689_001072 [Euphorbia peplus]
MSFTPLSSITKNSKNIRIKVRVARKWDFSSTYNPGQIFSFELLLLDEEGSSIQCTIPDQISETFRKQLLEGNIYHISGFNVIEARKVYRISTHPYRIRLPENAFVKEINEPNSNIPYDTFNFIDLSSVMERVSSVDFLCDTFGQAIRVGRIQQKRIDPQIKNLRTIFAQDTDGFEVEFTLWEESASTFPIDDVLSVAATKPVTIAFVGMIVKPYNGSYTVNSTFATKLYINPPIPDISNFLLRLKKPYTKLTEIEYGPNQVADIESEKMTNRKTISELLDVDIHIDKTPKQVEATFKLKSQKNSLQHQIQICN